MMKIYDISMQLPIIYQVCISNSDQSVIGKKNETQTYEFAKATKNIEIELRVRYLNSLEFVSSVTAMQQVQLRDSHLNSIRYMSSTVKQNCECRIEYYQPVPHGSSEL